MKRAKIIIKNKQYDLIDNIQNEKQILIIKMKYFDNIIKLHCMFKECNSLSSANLKNFITKYLRTIFELFNGCSSLIYIDDISNWNISNINDISGLFAECSSLKKLPDISKWNVNKVFSLKKLFFNCSSLISLPDISKWNIFNSNINNHIPYLKPMSYFIEDNIELLSFLNSISNYDLYMENIKFQISHNKSFNKEEQHSNLLSYDMSFLFARCSSLKYLPNISKWNIKNAKYISGMFAGCESLISLPDFSEWNTSKILDASYLFFKCTSLKRLPDISKWDLSNAFSISWMFYECSNLEYLPDISKWNISNALDISFMFYRCSKLKSLPNIR